MIEAYFNIFIYLSQYQLLSLQISTYSSSLLGWDIRKNDWGVSWSQFIRDKIMMRKEYYLTTIGNLYQWQFD